jgi:predicted transcriptional regulator
MAKFPKASEEKTAKKPTKKSTRKAPKPQVTKQRMRRAWNAPIVEATGNKKYVVRLSAEERERLEAMVHKGKVSAGHMRRAQILLKADVSEAGEAWSDSRIIEAMNTNNVVIYKVRKQLVEEGLDAVFTRKKRERPPVEKIFDGAKEAKLIALACSKPPDGYARWSLRLLEDKVVELNIVDKASDNTIGRVLKKTSLSLISKKCG